MKYFMKSAERIVWQDFLIRVHLNFSVSVIEGCHRTIGHRVLNKIQPINSDLFLISYGSKSCSLLDIRICCMRLISFLTSLGWMGVRSIQSSNPRCFNETRFGDI